MYKPKGVLVALVTPMNADETINETELRNQVKRHKTSGVHGIFCLGTNGEFYALSKEEKVFVMKTVIDEAKGEIPVCVGTGCITTKETVELTKIAEELKADAISVITPYFAGFSQDELYDHYVEVAKAAPNTPIILYNIPARTGVNLAHTTVAKLAQIDNIVAIKDSSGNFDNTMRYIESVPADFGVMAGNDSLILSTLMMGGVGAVAGCANIFPGKLGAIYDLFMAGKIDEAMKIQKEIRPLRDCLTIGNGNTVVKRVVNLLGYPVGPARKPVPGNPEKLDPVIKDTLEKYYKEWK